MGKRITKDDVIGLLKEGGKLIGGVATKLYEESLVKADEQAWIEAVELGIEKTIAALYEAKVSDREIIRVTTEYWKLDTQDVEERLIEEKWRAVIRTIERHLRLQGYTEKEINEFMKENMVSTKIRHNKELWMFKDNPERVLKAVKDNN